MLGTLFVCSVYGSDKYSDLMLNTDLGMLIGLITIPSYIFSFGIRYGDSSLMWPVYIIQFIVLIFFTYIIDRLIRRIYCKIRSKTV